MRPVPAGPSAKLDIPSHLVAVEQESGQEGGGGCFVTGAVVIHGPSVQHQSGQDP